MSFGLVVSILLMLLSGAGFAYFKGKRGFLFWLAIVSLAFVYVFVGSFLGEEAEWVVVGIVITYAICYQVYMLRTK